jgi:low affinity Fe/Cu permease
VPARPGDDPRPPTVRREHLGRGLQRLEAQRDRRAHRSRSSHVLHRLGAWSSLASTGVTVAVVLAGWAVVGAFVGFPHWWEEALYATTSAITVVMLFAIQHTQRREQIVTQSKLDELLRAQPEADNRLIAAEVADDDELQDLVEMGPDDPRTHALTAALDGDLHGREPEGREPEGVAGAAVPPG